MAKNFNYVVKESPFRHSRVDIIIPFHSQYEKVTKLITGIWGATRSNPYRITLVDDASPNDNFSKELSGKKGNGIQVIRNEKRLGFGASLAVGFSRTELPWILFLNSDCEIRDGNWMIEMGETLLKMKNNGVRMVSARSNNPGEYVNPYLKCDQSERGDNMILSEGHLPLYCAMCHRDLFSKIGGFIKPYPVGGYEDEELAFRMRHYGFKQGICGKSWVFHHGSATINQLCHNNQQIVDEMEKNRDRCLEDLRKLRK